MPIGEKYGFDHAPGYKLLLIYILVVFIFINAIIIIFSSLLYANKSVLAWHCSVLPDYTPDPIYFGWKKDEMKRMKVAGWITETGSGTNDLQGLIETYK